MDVVRNTKSKKLKVTLISLCALMLILLMAALAPLQVSAASSNVTFGQTITLNAGECREPAGGPYLLNVTLPSAGYVRVTMSHNDFRIEQEVSAGYYVDKQDRSWGADLSGWTGAYSHAETIYLPAGTTTFTVLSQRYTDLDSTISIRFTLV